MRIIGATVSALALLLTFGAGARAQTPNFRPITDEMLRNPSGADWLHWRRTYDGWAFSPLDQIDRENVGKLQLAWSRAFSEGNASVIPLVYDGVMYFAHPGGVVEALDARTGDLIWQYFHAPLQDDVRGVGGGEGGGGTTRNIAIYDDKIFYAAPEGALVALDARTGDVAWRTEITAPEDLARHTSGPIVVRGKVLTGRACNVGGLPGGCFLAAHDAQTGEELWRTFTIARPGQPGGDSWGPIPLSNRWHVSVWMPGNYDPELDLVYWGTGVPGPYPDLLRGTRGGSALYANSTLALDPDTGEIVWYYQHIPNDDWDVDLASERILVDTEIRPSADVPWFNPAAVGQQRKVVWAGGKMGVQWVLDRETGEFLWARPMLHQNIILDIDDRGRVDVDDNLRSKTIGDTVVVGSRAGKDWWPGAYSPLTNAVYQPLHNSWVAQTSLDWEGRGNGAARTTIPSPDQSGFVGMVKGYNVSTGELLFEYKQPAPWLGGLVATGGGLVFGGDMNRRFRALDQVTGEILWETILNARISASAISYAVDGRQYIAVAAGGGSNPSYERFDLTPNVPLEAPRGSNTIFVFALPESP